MVYIDSTTSVLSLSFSGGLSRAFTRFPSKLVSFSICPPSASAPTVFLSTSRRVGVLMCMYARRARVCVASRVHVMQMSIEPLAQLCMHAY